MWTQRQVEVVGRLYEAALDGTRWPSVLIDLAEAMGCRQSNLVIVERAKNHAQVIAPMWDDQVRRDFFGHWQRQFSLVKRTEHLPAGQVFTYGDLVDLDWFRATALFNEWWRPQGMGGGSLGANLICSGPVTALVTVHAAAERQGFTTDETRVFGSLVQHFARALTVQRRLQLASVVSGIRSSGMAEGLVVIDRSEYVLDGEPAAIELLERLKLLDRHTRGYRVSSRNLRARVGSAAEKIASHFHIADAASGQRFRLDVIPCGASEKENCSVSIDRPAVILSIEAADARAARRKKQLMLRYRLTRAEAAVAMQIAKGDGRAAAALRLNISPSTVRAHLNAIFEKTGVHRQAELVRLIET